MRDQGNHLSAGHQAELVKDFTDRSRLADSLGKSGYFLQRQALAGRNGQSVQAWDTALEPAASKANPRGQPVEKLSLRAA
jgi:hypothetical protein